MTENQNIPSSPTKEEYDAGADQGDVFTSNDPIELFDHWLKAANEFEINDPNSMALATVDASGMPDVRMVLLKDVSERGFGFYTNSDSAKGQQIAANPKAALCFHWKSIRRQVRVRGGVQMIDQATSDAYFATRSRGSKIGAWASKQSHPLEGEGVLAALVQEIEDKFEDREDIPRPPNWPGYLVQPDEIEFWVNRPFRLHDRLVFTRTTNGWTTKRLYP